MLTNAGIYPCRFDYATKEFMANKSTPLVKEEVSFELRTVAGSNYFFHKNYFTNSGNLEKMRENQKYFGNVRYMGIYPLRSIYDQCIDDNYFCMIMKASAPSQTRVESQAPARVA